MHPRRRPDVVARVVDGELVVLDHRRNRVHQLNATARSIWDVCDGTRSPADIVGVVRAEFPDAPDSVVDDVHAALAQLREVGLLD